MPPDATLCLAILRPPAPLWVPGGHKPSSWCSGPSGEGQYAEELVMESTKAQVATSLCTTSRSQAEGKENHPIFQSGSEGPPKESDLGIKARECQCLPFLAKQ